MFSFLKKDPWSPYIVGGSIGILLIVSYIFFDHLIGTSKAFTKVTILVEGSILKTYTQNVEYYQKFIKEPAFWDWQISFVIAIFLGSWVASKLSKSKTANFVPYFWEKNLGSSKILRAIGAFVGGIFLMFGARLGGGCTSGHAISGASQLALSSWIFVGALFFVGIIVAFLLYPSKMRAKQ